MSLEQRYLSRIPGCDARTYLLGLSYDAAIQSTFEEAAGRPVTQHDLEVLVPEMLAAVPDRAGAFDFEAALVRLSSAAGRLVNLRGAPDGLAARVLWACAVRSLQESAQPHYHWAWIRTVDALHFAGRPDLVQTPFEVTLSRAGGLLAATTDVAPDGTPVVTFHHDVVFVGDYARLRYLADREMATWTRARRPERELWGLVRFAAIAEALIQTDHVLDPRLHLPVPPHGTVECSAQDRALASRFGEVLTTFLTLHEYGHIALDHLRGRVRDLHELEYEADLFALKALESTPSFRTYDLVCIGTLLHDLARARALSGEPLSSPTHPSPLERLTRLIDGSTRVPAGDKAVLRALQSLPAGDRGAAGILVRKDRTGGMPDRRPRRLDTEWGSDPDEKVARGLSEVPGAIPLGSPPPDPRMRSQSCQMVRALTRTRLAFQSCLQEILGAPQLRPPFEIDAIQSSNGVVQFRSAPLGGRPAEVHDVRLLILRFDVGADRSLHVSLGDRELDPARTVSGHGGAQEGPRHVVVELGEDRRYYEVGSGLLLPPRLGALERDTEARIDGSGNLVLRIRTEGLRFPDPETSRRE